MSAANADHVDFQALHAAHPIEDVIAWSGVELRRHRHGYLGRCPFHGDAARSMSVGAVPNRFRCLGCGAGGDVIEYVSRRYNLSLNDSIEALANGSVGGPVDDPPLRPRIPGRPELPRIGADRGYEINQLAWEHFATPVAAQFAYSYLARRRGIDLGALRAFSAGAPIVGYAGIGWTTLVTRLRDKGVTDEELLVTDLAQLTGTGRLVDTYRGRIIIPVTSSASQVVGFVGRDVTGDSRAAKYRNPTRTATFNKSTTLYRPTHHDLAADGNVVIVEGVLDALAIAAVAARTGEMDRFAPCATSGVRPSHEQVCRVLALHARPPVLAMGGDTGGDEGGADGTGRWLSGLCLDSGRTTLVTRLPAGSDPAAWLALQGDHGLSAFDHRGWTCPDGRGVQPSVPGRELVRLLAGRHIQPAHAVLTNLVPLAAQLPLEPAAALLREAEQEMTRLGWNPNGAFTRALREAVARDEDPYVRNN